MKKLTFNQKKESLTSDLKNYKFSDKYFIQHSDQRLGQKFAIASNIDNGAISIHTDYMTFDEMNCFFTGYYIALNNPLN